MWCNSVRDHVLIPCILQVIHDAQVRIFSHMLKYVFAIIINTQSNLIIYMYVCNVCEECWKSCIALMATIRPFQYILHWEDKPMELKIYISFFGYCWVMWTCWEIVRK